MESLIEAAKQVLEKSQKEEIWLSVNVREDISLIKN